VVAAIGRHGGGLTFSGGIRAALRRKIGRCDLGPKTELCGCRLDYFLKPSNT